METLHKPALPRAARLNVNRLDPVLLQPPLHDLRNELRAVVTSQIRRCAVLLHRLLQPVQHIRRLQRPFRPQHMTLRRAGRTANSFPVQLALLSNAQWRIAAGLPRVLDDSRKLIEQQMAEYRRHSKALTDEFVGTTRQQMAELKSATETVRVASKNISNEFAEAEAVVRRTRSLIDGAVHEWHGIKATTTEQCHELEQISNGLQTRFAWREILWARSGLR